MLQEIADTLSAPRKWLWSMLPGLHDDTTGEAYSGSQVANNAFGLDPESVWGKALGFGLEVAGDPLNLAMPLAGRAVAGLTGLKYGAEAPSAYSALKNARNTFGVIKQVQPVAPEFATAVHEAAAAGALPRRAVTDAAANFIGESTGKIGPLGTRAMNMAAPDIASGYSGGSFFPAIGEGTTTGVAVSGSPAATRHEIVHGLINSAGQSGNYAGLPMSMKIPAYLGSRENSFMRGVGQVFNEAAAHASEARGGMNQAKNYIKFLMNPNPGYFDQVGAISPAAASAFQAMPYATAAGGAGALGAGGYAAYRNLNGE